LSNRNICIICGEDATCFYHYDGGYIPFCIHHFSEYTNTTSIDNKITNKKDLEEYMWRR